MSWFYIDLFRTSIMFKKTCRSKRISFTIKISDLITHEYVTPLSPHTNSSLEYLGEHSLHSHLN
jgi:hypothetical protein